MKIRMMDNSVVVVDNMLISRVLHGFRVDGYVDGKFAQVIFARKPGLRDAALALAHNARGT